MPQPPEPQPADPRPPGPSASGSGGSLSSGDDVVASDGVVILRPLRPGDAEAHLAGEDDLARRFLSGGVSTPETVSRWLGRSAASWAAGSSDTSLAIELASPSTLVGMVGFVVDIPGIGDGEINLSYGLYPEFRGRGLATRAVGLACRIAAVRWGIRRVVIRTEPANPASAAVARRAGFAGDGRVSEADGIVFDRWARTV